MGIRKSQFGLSIRQETRICQASPADGHDRPAGTVEGLFFSKLLSTNNSQVIFYLYRHSNSNTYVLAELSISSFPGSLERSLVS